MNRKEKRKVLTFSAAGLILCMIALFVAEYLQYITAENKLQISGLLFVITFAILQIHRHKKIKTN